MEQIRTFVAIELDESCKAGLTKLQDRLKAEVPEGIVRWVRQGGIHLTLKFLGDVRADRIEEISQAIKDACQGFSPFSFSIGGLGCFPHTRRPRVLWVGVEEPTGALADLQASIEEALIGLGFKPERHRFHPHLTLGRTRRRAGRSQVRRLGELIESTTTGEVGGMEAEAVSLMRSDLRPTGAVYSQLAEVKLAASRQQ